VSGRGIMYRGSRKARYTMRKLLRRIMSISCALTVMVTGIPVQSYTVAAASHSFDDEAVNVMLDSGGFKTELYGVGTDNWGESYKSRTQTLPPSTVYLTDNYKNTVGTVPTSDWASSVVFDKYSESLYAHPLAYRAASNGMQMAYPAVLDATSGVDDEPMVTSLLNDGSVELVVGATGFSAKDAKVDKTTDWTYEIVMENSAGTASMRSTISKGTPFAYYTFNNLSPTISLGAGATSLAIYKNSTASNVIGVSLTNKTDGKTHYYLVAAPEGTTWTNAGGKLTANLPSGGNYMSVAILPDGTDSTFGYYQNYAFNFITNSTVEWEYLPNAGKVLTRYSVETKNMATGAKGGDTIMALYPHQWRYTDATFTGYTYNTIRGTMKTVAGTSYTTSMDYTGILSALPSTSNDEYIGTIKTQLGYLYDYRKNKADPKWIAFLEGQYGGYDTYWVGKNLNTLSDAITIAEQYMKDDSDMSTITNDMLEGLEHYLEFWFDPYQAYQNGDFVDDYFYYNADYGTLIGYPASYSSDSEMNDHHFHYGYWIKAAATIAMYDPEWAQEWGAMVYELISDIANTNRDGSSYNENSPAKYPFLRNFDIYEGHSWASGVANYEYDANGNMIDPNGGLAGGNNQESSSEAINAWASLVLWGEAMGNDRIRDLGIYLYTTEVAAVEDYYYDVHDEIFTNAYEDKNNYDIQTVTRLFGGRYDHTAWWTENSIEVTTITMLPISAATLYMGKYPQKVKAVYDSVSEQSKQWTHFVANKNQICANYGKTDMLTDPGTNQDIMAEYYAFYDADAALSKYDMTDNGKVENGESRAHTFHYITSLKQYGTQNFNITGSTAMSLVLEKNGVKTYVAENHSDSPVRVYYSDGAYVDVPARTNYAGAKTGTGENPNVDDSELGSNKKFMLETYLQKYDGSGYEMTSKSVAVKTEDNSYTYEPATINGFTYDRTNSNNHLTVDVTEGTVETVKVYYKRNTYSISYVLNGGTVATANPTSYKYGSEIALNTATKKGYIFLGWFTDADLTSSITEITPSTYGNLKLYAGFVDATLVSNYTVEYYIMSDNREFYSLAADQTKVVSSYVGTNVTAEDKAFSGYVLNPNSTTTGVVLPDDQLVLRMYYDIPKAAENSIGNGHGVHVDNQNKLSLYVADAASNVNQVFVYYKIFNDSSSANAAYNTVMSGDTSQIPGYPMGAKNSEGIFVQEAGTVSDSQYILYRFNENDQLLTDWVLVNIKTAKDQEQEQTVVKSNYTIKYYKQKENLSGYTEVTADKVTLEGEVGTGVVAKVNSYDGYVINADKSKLTGTVADNNGLTLNVYYDVVRTTVSSHKYTLEVYKEKLEGGYDMTYKVVSVDTQSNTYTYQPVEIDGFVFDSSNSNNNLTVDVSEGTIETVKVYYNRREYSISYYKNGGTATNPATYKYGEAVTFEDAVKSGYIFDGWYTDSTYNTKTTGFAAGTTGDISVYAKFVSESDVSSYSTMYYKMAADGKSYELAESNTTDSAAGLTVNAVVKNYSGYTLNDNSNTSGTVLPNGKLVLRLYYDLDVETLASSDSGIKLDSEGNVIGYLKAKGNESMCIMYMDQYTNENEVKSKVQSTNADGNPAGIPGYPATLKNGYYETNLGKKPANSYIFFAYNTGAGPKGTATYAKVSDLSTSVGEATVGTYTVKYYKKNDSGNYTLANTMTYDGYVGYVAVAAVIDYDSYAVNETKSQLTGVVLANGGLTLNVYYDKVEMNQNEEQGIIEINGYQISYLSEGMRTVYSVSDTINGKSVVEKGMIYGIYDEVSEADLYVGNKSAFVKSYPATSRGKLAASVSSTDDADSYAMTLLFAKKNKTEFNTRMYIRAYAKLSDGTYVYSDVYNYTIASVAEKLYKDCSMPTEAGHNYLYNSILKVVNPSYGRIDY
jgi:uncharacterized repeat protein (TIGR02543 family)